MKISLCVLMAALALVLAACEQEKKQHSPNHIAKPVVVLNISPENISSSIEAVGTAQANESITITAKVSGRLEKVLFSDGQDVNKGAVIALLDQDEEQAQLTTAKVQLAEHRREIERLNKLVARHAAPVRDLDERKTLAAVTRSSIKAIEARIAELTLTAPFDGKLGIRQLSPGALIQPGMVITTLDQTNPIKLDFTLPATQLQGITIGTEVQAVSDALAGAVFKGKVTALDSRINPVTRTILVRARLDNGDKRLIPGMLMQLKVQQRERLALIVPEESITQKQDKHYITLIKEDHTAELRAIEIGQRFYGFVEVLKGLTAGEQVVVRGMEFIRPGAKVEISETWGKMRDSHFPNRHTPDADSTNLPTMTPETTNTQTSPAQVSK